MIPSFMIGICWAALLATNGNIIAAATLIVQRFMMSAGLNNIYPLSALLNNWNVAIFTFLCCLGTLIVLLQKTGAATAYGNFVKKFVASRHQVEIASMILSLFFFIDDYFSALTVGSVMRPLAHLYRLNPLKLAFLVTAMASPITIMSPISSWVGEIILQLKQAGISHEVTSIVNADPFYAFVHAIPFIFYALLLIAGTWYIVLRGISFGPMARHETLTPPSAPQNINLAQKNGSLIDFLFPLCLLIGSIFTILLITGQYTLFGGINSFTVALKQGIVHQALLYGGLITVIISSMYFVCRQKITRAELASCIHEGSWLMIPSIIMLVHAWTLGALLKLDLHTGDYIAQLFGSVVSLPLFPAICFIASGFISLLIGSAWATMGLMFPIAVPMLPTLLAHGDILPIILPVIGAILSGCVMGTHLSFIADNPIMSAASTGANHIEHIKTMAWYIVPIGIATATAYGFLGCIIMHYSPATSLGLSLAAGLATTILLLEVGQYIFGAPKKHKKN